jgi:hypothetical protein
VPLSGAMKEYSDDVVVGEDVNQKRVECKYRAQGAGFKRLHDWHPGKGFRLELTQSGLYVFTLEDWLEFIDFQMHQEIADEHGRGVAHEPPLQHVDKDVTEQKTLLDWLGEADALAVRRQRKSWLVCVRVEAIT